MFNSGYVGVLTGGDVFAGLPAAARAATEESVGAASVVAPQLGAAAPLYLAEVSEAFLSGLSVACLVAAGVAAAGAVFALRFLPARATPAMPAPEVVMQG